MSEYQREYRLKNRDELNLKQRTKRARGFKYVEDRKEALKRQCENLKKYGRLD